MPFDDDHREALIEPLAPERPMNVQRSVGISVTVCA